MKLASIDIGTNTTRLLIAEATGKQTLNTILRLAKITRLGEGVSSSRAFKPEAIKRTVAVLAEYQMMIEEEGVSTVRVVATSAARDAKNASEFIEQVGQIGFKVEILAGEEEAKFAFSGATHSLKSLPLDHRYLVIDIGGGSTEFILGREEKIEQLYSFDLGSVRLTEMFFQHDPPLSSGLEQARQFISSETEKTFQRLDPFPLAAIGVAGTVTTIAAVKQKMVTYDPEKIHRSKLTVAEIERVLQLFLSLPLEERKKLPGLEPARADVIVAGTLILLESLRLLGLAEITVSEHDLLDGLILSLL